MMNSMRLSPMTILIASALAAIVWTMGTPAQANHAGYGNTYPNYLIINNGTMKVCDNSSYIDSSNMQAAVANWSAVGKSILTEDCNLPNVRFDNDPGITCDGVPSGQWLGCTEFPGSESDVFMQGDIGATLDQPPNNFSDRKNHVVTHEIGHALDLLHFGACPPDMMAPAVCSPEPTSLSSNDLGRYNGIYDAPYPVSISASSPSVGQVTVNWDGSNVHSESRFGIYRWDWNNSSWTLLTSVFALKDTTSKTFAGQPGGTQRYTVGSLTAAGCNALGGLCPFSPSYAELNVIAGADLVVTSAVLGSATVSEGNTGSTWNISVKNQGNSNAGAFAARVEFGGAGRSYPQGVCSFNLGMVAGQTLSCTTSSVTADFGGGAMTVRADYANQVTETNESNNVQTGGGTFAVIPTPPDESQNDIVTWPAGGSFVCGAVGGNPCYAWKDRSNIENGSSGYTIEIQNVASSSCSGTFNVQSTSSWNGVSGTGTTTYKSFSPFHGFCYRIRVKANGPTASSALIADSQPQWFP